VQGPQGPQGEQGPHGEQGVQGPQGEKSLMFSNIVKLKKNVENSILTFPFDGNVNLLKQCRIVVSGFGTVKFQLMDRLNNNIIFVSQTDLTKDLSVLLISNFENLTKSLGILTLYGYVYANNIIYVESVEFIL
jgi:hypothetical protein